ncbi:MAG: DNA alkylation repair protein [Alphaproteobacteria bacterium]|nr:DNA alkylation repair protein [Alphaproteobacteria bacterium]
MTSIKINNILKNKATKAKAERQASFFKTGPGEYSAHDKFMGVTVPEIRVVIAEHRDLPEDEISKLLDSPWHEARMAGLLIMVHQFRTGDTATQKRIYSLYTRRFDAVNNWDLVDNTASQIAGAWLHGKSHAPLFKWARSKDLWTRRIAIVACHYDIKLKKFDSFLKITKNNISETHDLMHKATGWMLREAGKVDIGVLRGFLDEHAGVMPRTMLRYAIEKLPERERKNYMKK